jgi:hypothetical protein
MATQPNQVFAKTQDGFHSQFGAIVDAYRAGDKATGQRLIEHFRLPDSEQWFADHLGAEQKNSNRQARPFTWTATADSILDKVERLSKGIYGTAL